jgi:hypothetical protein
VTLDDAIAALEAKMAAEREAEALNLAAVDAACRRFAELASDRIFADDTELADGSGWLVKMSTIRIVVRRDGSWERRYSSIVEVAPSAPLAAALEAAMAVQLVGSLPRSEK